MSENHASGTNDPRNSAAPGDGSSPRETDAPDSPRPRRKGALIGGVTGGVAVLCIGAVAVAMMSGGDEPYASTGSCDELLTEDILSGANGIGDTEIEEEQSSTDSSEDGEVVESLECAAINEETESALFLTLTRFDPGTASDGYAAVHDDREQSISELADSYGVNLDEANSGGDSGVTSEEVSFGDGGHAYSIEGSGGESIGIPRTSTVIYSAQNMNVHVMYQGGEDLSTDEHMGMATDTGASVEERIADTAEVE